MSIASLAQDEEERFVGFDGQHVVVIGGSAGIGCCPDAIAGLYRGENLGRRLVRL